MQALVEELPPDAAGRALAAEPGLLEPGALRRHYERLPWELLFRLLDRAPGGEAGLMAWRGVTNLHREHRDLLCGFASWAHLRGLVVGTVGPGDPACYDLGASRAEAGGKAAPFLQVPVLDLDLGPGPGGWDLRARWQVCGCVGDALCDRCWLLVLAQAWVVDRAVVPVLLGGQPAAAPGRLWVFSGRRGAQALLLGSPWAVVGQAEAAGRGRQALLALVRSGMCSEALGRPTPAAQDFAGGPLRFSGHRVHDLAQLDRLGRGPDVVRLHDICRQALDHLVARLGRPWCQGAARCDPATARGWVRRMHEEALLLYPQPDDGPLVRISAANKLAFTLHRRSGRLVQPFEPDALLGADPARPLTTFDPLRHTDHRSAAALAYMDAAAAALAERLAAPDTAAHAL